jgi:hypothetical protein
MSGLAIRPGRPVVGSPWSEVRSVFVRLAALCSRSILVMLMLGGDGLSFQQFPTPVVLGKFAKIN